MQPPFVRPFHFWCQKVLPLVFDDSLSYYEVLAKMRDYLNEAIKEINSIGGEFDGVKTQITQLQTYVDEYFAGLDVNQAISDRLDNMVESGEMDAVITPIFAAYANPLFAASVADMIATNFAYANYENNKIYTFNQSTGLYQTTGKEFGGVVSSVNEMEDNDKYYALDSDGMLYSYDYPQSAFVATGLTYGGYRYGVNAMRPISNVYVLTTDSHVYTWNGSEYVDSGVVYGLNNTAFIWRRKLSSADNITLLVTDGWYYFKSDSLPRGLPVNMETSDGFAVVYSIPNDTDDSDNMRSEAAQDVQTQRTQDIRVDSRNKRIVLRTNNGGSWFWNGLTWVDENEIGFPVCENCNSISWNSVCYCNEGTINAPTDNSGLLKTFAVNGEKAQMFFDENNAWFRRNNGAWIRVVRHDEQEENVRNLSTLYSDIRIVQESTASVQGVLLNGLKLAQEQIDNLYSLTVSSVDMPLRAENDDYVCAETGAELCGSIPVAKTDATLTEEYVPADARAVGDRLFDTNLRIDETNEALEVEKVVRERGDEQSREYVDSIMRNVFTTVGKTLVAENSDVITAENGESIDAEVFVQVTDKTLTQENVPADAMATGEALRENLEQSETNLANATSYLSNKVNAANATAKSNSQKIANAEQRISLIESTTTATAMSAIMTESNAEITTQNGENLFASIIVAKTDKTLTQENVPADAMATGEALRENESTIAKATSYLNNKTNAANISAGRNSTKISELQAKISTLEAKTLDTTLSSIESQNAAEITTENGFGLFASLTVAKTDKTLTQENVPADAKSVGEMLSKNNYDYERYLSIESAIGNYKVPVVKLYGELPLTKTNVNVQCVITQGLRTLYNGSAKLKVQGSSSVRAPEKNYTLKLTQNITIFEYTTNVWNLKCNFTDPSQCRNIVGARTWKRCLEQILPAGEIGEMSTQNTDTITTESGTTINVKNVYTLPIQNSPHWGTTDGEIVYVIHDDEFHGVYTMQIQKGEYMFGMSLSQNQFVLSNNGWRFTPFNNIDEFRAQLEIEEASDDMTEEVIYEKINAFANFIANSTNEEFLSGIGNYINYDTVLAYMAFALFLQHWDGIIHNINMYSYDGGNTLGISAWDMDGTFGFSAGGFIITIAGYRGGSGGNDTMSNEYYGTKSIGTNITDALNSNALFRRIKQLDPNGFKNMYNQLRNTCLTPNLVLYDFTCMQLYSSEAMFQMDFKKWPMKNKTLLKRPELAALYSTLNAQVLDQKVNAL